MNRRLYRCNHDQRIAGVASGLAEYLGIDVTLLRVLWVVSIFFGGLGLLLYVIMAIVVPLEPEGEIDHPSTTGADDTVAADAAAGVPAAHRHASRGGSGLGLTLIGAVLILGGGLALLDAFFPAWSNSGRVLWPAFVLGVGVLLVATATRRSRHPL